MPFKIKYFSSPEKYLEAFEKRSEKSTFWQFFEVGKSGQKHANFSF
jgi:hypothetical protein